MAKKHSKLLRSFSMLFGLCVGGAISFLVFTPEAFYPVDDPSLPVKAADMVILAFCIGGLMVWGCVSSLRKNKKSIEKSSDRPRLKRSKTTLGSGYLLWQLSLLMMIFISFDREAWNGSTVRTESDHSIYFCFLVGVVAYYAFAWSLHYYYKWRGINDRASAEILAVLASIWPRNRKQKRLAWVAVCLLNPITEEFYFRGLLVSQFHCLIDSPYIPILLGLVVNSGYHLYQGTSQLVTHIPFYCISVALLYSPVGLTGCFGLHFAGDLLPVQNMKVLLQHYKDTYRRHKDDTNRAEEPMPQSERQE